MFKSRLKFAFLAPITLFLISMTIFPLFFLIFTSLTDRAATQKGTNFVGLKNYVNVFLDGQFHQSIIVTFVITFFSVALQLSLGLILALSFTNIQKNLWLLRAIYLIPMAAAPVATLFNWRFMLSTTSGIINYLLSFLGIPAVGWLDSRAVALCTIILVETWMWTPFVFILLTSALSSVEKNIVEAAAVDGANRLKIATQIYIPILKPFLIIALVLRVIDAAKSFDTIQILTSGGPGYDTASFNFLIFQNAIQYLNFGSASAEAVILIIILTVISRTFFNRLNREKDSK